jgi:hypothetical protein
MCKYHDRSKGGFVIGEVVRTRSCGSSSTGCAGTSSWILCHRVNISQVSAYPIINVLAIATDLCVESSGWCSWRLIDAEREFGSLWLAYKWKPR